MKTLHTFIARAALAVSAFAVIVTSDAQVINPSQPATGVPTAGTGISVSGQQVSVNYGVANSPFTGNLSAANLTGTTSVSTPSLAASAVTASGTVQGANVTATSTVQGATVTATGTMNTAALNVTGAVTGVVQNVDNITALRSTVAAAASATANVNSYYSGWTTPSGGGAFTWNATSVATDNGCTVIKVGSVTTGRWIRTLSNRLPVEACGAQGGAVNDAAAFAAALSSGVGEVDAFGPAYTINSQQTIPVGVTLRGSGRNATTINIGADVVGIELLTYAQLHDVKVAPSVAHTHDCIWVGDVTNDGGRAIIEDVQVSGCGGSGIVLNQGNLTTYRDIMSLSNAVDGIQFTTNSINNNAAKLEGTIDLRANTRDGLHLSNAGTLTSPSNPRANSGNLVVTQSNGRYGVYVGTSGNVFTLYSEANTTKDLFIDTLANGNFFAFTDTVLYTDNGQANVISSFNPQATYWRHFDNKTYFAGGSGKGLRIDNTDATAGQLDIEKTAAVSYALTAQGSAQDATLAMTNSGGAFNFNLSLKGNVFPPTTNTQTVGTSSLFFNNVYSTTGTHGNLILSAVSGTSAAAQLNIGAQSSGAATTGAAGALPSQPVGYLVWSWNGATIKVPYYNN